MGTPTLEDAIALAATAHRGQFYPASAVGRDPFIVHPLRVMLRLVHETDRIVGVLHDVVEDTSCTVADLSGLGYDERILRAVDAISRRPSESYLEYVRRIETDEVATRVKLADLSDNLQYNRGFGTPAEDAERFARWRAARRQLNAVTATSGRLG